MVWTYVHAPPVTRVTTDAPTALRKTFVKCDADVKDTVMALSNQDAFDAHKKGQRSVKIDASQKVVMRDRCGECQKLANTRVFELWNHTFVGNIMISQLTYHTCDSKARTP